MQDSVSDILALRHLMQRLCNFKAAADAAPSCRLSCILVAPDRRGKGNSAAMVARAAAFAFCTHHVGRIDLGVEADNTTAIACYR